MKIVLVMLLLAAACWAQDWQLVWSDEFDGPEIDATHWTYEVNGSGGGNNELQYYTDRPDNSFIKDGKLVIVGKKETFTGPDGTRQYTSARMVTRGNADWKYGKFEISAKLPFGQGIWPAIWMMPRTNDYGGWAACGEIDIMEMVGHEPATVHGTLHYGGQWPDNVHTGSPFVLPDGNFNDAFHIFTLEWEEGEIRWYVDGDLYATQTEWYTTGAPYPAPYDQPFYLILNLAIGGNWPGSPDASTVFPQRFEIDYIRVYQDQSENQPELQLQAPEGAYVEPYETIELSANPLNVLELINRVDFFCGETRIGFDRTSPYSFSWENVYPGCYEIHAEALLRSGKVMKSAHIPVQVGPECVQAPYSGNPVVVPGTVEAEMYDLGGQGIAYFDNTPQNEGNAYSNTFRQLDGVDCQPCNLGGVNVGWITAGEWMEYYIYSEKTQSYTVTAQIATTSSNNTFRLYIDNENLTGNINVPNSGDWQNWRTVTSPAFEITAGAHIFRFLTSTGGFNLNKFVFSAISTGVADAAAPQQFSLQQNYPNPFNPSTTITFSQPFAQHVNLAVYDVSGRLLHQLINKNYPAGEHQIVFDAYNLPSGVYFYCISTDNFTDSKKMLLIK